MEKKSKIIVTLGFKNLIWSATRHDLDFFG